MRRRAHESIRHLELTFIAEKPPPPHALEQVALMAAEESGEYEERRLEEGSGLSPFGRIPGRST